VCRKMLKRAMGSAARRILAPLRFQVDMVEGETELIPGVRTIPAPGHTPGHLALLISSEGQHLLNLGDAAVHPLHLERPDWENGFDLGPPGRRPPRAACCWNAPWPGICTSWHFISHSPASAAWPRAGRAVGNGRRAGKRIGTKRMKLAARLLIAPLAASATIWPWIAPTPPMGWNSGIPTGPPSPRRKSKPTPITWPPA